MKKVKTVVALMLVGTICLYGSMAFATPINSKEQAMSSEDITVELEDKDICADPMSLNKKTDVVLRYIEEINLAYGDIASVTESQLIEQIKLMSIEECITSLNDELQDWIDNEARCKVVRDLFDSNGNIDANTLASMGIGTVQTSDFTLDNQILPQSVQTSSNGYISTLADNNKNIRMSIYYNKQYNPTRFTKINDCTSSGVNGYRFEPYVAFSQRFSNQNKTCLVEQQGSFFKPNGFLIGWRYTAQVVLLA